MAVDILFEPIYVEEWRSGQSQQTVNLPSLLYGGSNPSSSTTKLPHSAQIASVIDATRFSQLLTQFAHSVAIWRSLVRALIWRRFAGLHSFWFCHSRVGGYLVLFWISGSIPWMTHAPAVSFPRRRESSHYMSKVI
jgi:hypothetical protein